MKLFWKNKGNEKGKSQSAVQLKVQGPGLLGISTTGDKSFEQLLKIPVSWGLNSVQSTVMKKNVHLLFRSLVLLCCSIESSVTKNLTYVFKNVNVW